MDWNIAWLVGGTLSVILGCANAICAFVQKQHSTNYLLISIFFSLGLEMVVLVSEYRMVNQWMTFGETAHMKNTIENLSQFLTYEVIAILALNFLAIIVYMFKERNK